MSQKMAELFPHSIYALNYMIHPAVAVTEVQFKTELGNAIRVLKGLPVPTHDIGLSQALFGRLACYNPCRPDGAKWIARGIIDYDPQRCGNMSAATEALTVGPYSAISFLVFDAQVQSDIPVGTMVRFNKQTRVVPSWKWDEKAQRYADEVKHSAVNVAPA